MTATIEPTEPNIETMKRAAAAEKAEIAADFETWWDQEGSGMPPLQNEEACEHVRRVSAIAWKNGAMKGAK